jgi:MFS family permease
VVGAGSYTAPLVAITQRIMPVHLRALATALMYLLLNLIGPGAGPTTAGFLNDLLARTYGNEAVRISLTLTLVGAVAGVTLILYATRELPGDLTLADQAAQAQPRSH